MKIYAIILLLFVQGFLSVAQTNINGITFPDVYNAGKDKLIINGGGTREKLWMDMYVAALYLKAKSKDANSIVMANSSMAIRISIVSGLITSSRMKEAVDEGFKKSCGGKESVFKEQIEKFKQSFTDEIKKGDVFDIVFLEESFPATAKILVYKNNILKSEIPGLDFKKAVFGIWLGNEPVDSDLKEQLLGGN
jgi:hypothetical protein